MIKVSIIIPVYNAAKYIRRCISSVIDQENADCGIECIIVNDFSSDDSAAIIREMVAGYKGKIEFVICNHERNKGVSAARNTGMRNATGNYLFFIDSDDYISVDCLNTMVKYQNIYPNVDVILGSVFSRKYNRPFFPSISKPTLMADNSQVLLKVFFAELHFHVWNRLIRRDLLVDNNLFFAEGYIYEDMPWTYKLYTVMSSILVLPDFTYVYENNEESIMNTTNQKANYVVNSSCYVINYILDNIYYVIRSDCRIYCFGILLRTLEIIFKFSCSEDVKKIFSKVRKRLLKEAIFSGRPLMFFFFLTSYKPLVYIYRLSSVRHNYHKITVVFSKVERWLDQILCKAG
jgi:glycosyltransferase involved in cell wall biosynthesis